MQTATIDRTKEWTLDDYLMLGEMNTTCQLVNGKLIRSPSPTPYHQIVSGNLNDILKTEGQKTGAVTLFAPMDLYVDYKNVFQPSLIYISKENKKIITDRAIEGTPDLIVEVVSPADIFLYWNTKRRVYREIGVKEYWIVDPGNRTLEIYLSSQTNPDVPYLYRVEEGEVTSTVIPSLAFDLKTIFLK
jgi:Uma2 family endonuclease